MTTITIITIVVVALLTILIFALTWLAYSSCLKTYSIEVSQGKYDKAIFKEYHSKKHRKKGLVGLILSYVSLAALLALFTTGIVYKARGENFSINNNTALVIKTGSMSGFFNDEIAEYYNNDTSLQFNIGDICIFETEFNLVEGEVYGYKTKSAIITHRLVKIYDNGLCEFRGDANPSSDGFRVNPDNIIYHYTGTKVPGVGAFILYAQSYFGFWSFIGVIGVVVSSEIVYYQINKINKARDKDLGGNNYEK